MQADALKKLVTSLQLERLEENLFRGAVGDTLIKRVYGGKVLGEAIGAAQATVSRRAVHSIHAYFLREAESYNPVIYEVDRSRDGRSFSARRVVAIQHGKPIFTLEASFHKPEPGLQSQTPRDKVPDPDDLAPLQFDWSRFDNFSARIQRLMTISAPFDVRPVEDFGQAHNPLGNPIRRTWVRTCDKLPDDPDLHRAVLAYVSDYGLVWTVIAAHDLSITNDKLMVASLDHAMWFHRPFRIDEWLLYCCEGVTSFGARGLARGAFFRQSGELVVSVAQEGLMRVIS